MYEKYEKLEIEIRMYRGAARAILHGESAAAGKQRKDFTTEDTERTEGKFICC